MPKVSVIIPNYNHAKYLVQRIESVLTQTLRDTEVVILDDCSPDNSREIIERYAQQDNRIRVVYNEQNSGNTFKQWNKGIGEATGEYVWIAESDDYADTNFLAVLVARLDADSAVGVAYCDSWLTDEANAVNLVDRGYLHRVDPARWAHSFTCDGMELIRHYMSFVNVIPNASAVVLRRSLLAEIGAAATDYKLAGDWLYWGRILSVTKVAYVAERLNYFRQHTNNVRSKVRGGNELLQFSYAISQMRQYGEPDAEMYAQAMERNFEWWFYIMVYSDFSVSNHLKIYKNFAYKNGKFPALFFKNAFRLVYKDKFNGLRHIVGGKILKRPSFSPPHWFSM
ncbi:glycosyltransferase family 2 protein [Hymenobacter caeli]|uniref:Glycosyltransferase involved in cell wall biosynthesis n=1 Tax=Hymenobacter caeli TaxID=2735894 RepID=A0ABX2FJX7_9BACT|nr:glycosyltransferase family 2 protein [Hymenobacter caeli]NRT17272.1 glycosyltransferase involved in cell wall biosynthesis [Hymenobacter caeli]